MQSGAIPVRDIRMWFDANKLMLQHAKRVSGRSFYDVHCARVMKHKFRAACVALRHRKRFTEPLSDREIWEELRHPAAFCEIMSFRRYKLFHLFFFIIGKLPPVLSIRAAYVVGKLIRWI